jgi:hypothetical protein
MVFVLYKCHLLGVFMVDSSWFIVGGCLTVYCLNQNLLDFKIAEFLGPILKILKFCKF